MECEHKFEDESLSEYRNCWDQMMMLMAAVPKSAILCKPQAITFSDLSLEQEFGEPQTCVCCSNEKHVMVRFQSCVCKDAPICELCARQVRRCLVTIEPKN